MENISNGLDKLQKETATLSKDLQVILDYKGNVPEEFRQKTRLLYQKVYKSLEVDYTNVMNNSDYDDDYSYYYSVLDYYDVVINLVVNNSDVLKGILNLDDTNLSFLREVITEINRRKAARYRDDPYEEYAFRGL